MKLNFTSPLNPTGYGTAGWAYLLFFDSLVNSLISTKHLSKKLEISDFSFRCIGNPQLHPNEFGAQKYASVLKKYSRPIDSPVDEDTINLVFWHPGVADDYLLPCKKNILLTTFELDSLTPKEISSMSKFDKLIFASNYNKRIAGKYPILQPKIGEELFPHLSYVAEKTLVKDKLEPIQRPYFDPDLIIPLDRKELLDYLSLSELKDNPMIYSSIGKYEERKGQKFFLENSVKRSDSITRVLIAFWYNPFIWPNLPFGDLISLGFSHYKTTDNFFIYNKDKFYVVLHKPVNTRKSLYSIATAADLFIDSSRAEGFGLPLYDILSIENHKQSILSTFCEGSLDYILAYCNWKGKYPGNVHCAYNPGHDKKLCIAKDDYFFSNNLEGKWLSLDDAQFNSFQVIIKSMYEKELSPYLSPIMDDVFSNQINGVSYFNDDD